MTYKIIFLPVADQQLKDLDDYLESVGAETDFVDRIIDCCETLATFPNRHMELPHLYPGLRITGYQNRVAILYRVVDEEVHIMGIHYGGQDYEAKLKGRISLFE